jgi:hypothetical protein
MTTIRSVSGHGLSRPPADVGMYPQPPDRHLERFLQGRRVYQSSQSVIARADGRALELTNRCSNGEAWRQPTNIPRTRRTAAGIDMGNARTLRDGRDGGSVLLRTGAVTKIERVGSDYWTQCSPLGGASSVCRRSHDLRMPLAACKYARGCEALL